MRPLRGIGDEMTEHERDTSGRWAVAVVVTILIIALLAFARGPDNHRGDEVGARPVDDTIVVSEPV